MNYSTLHSKVKLRKILPRVTAGLLIYGTIIKYTFPPDIWRSKSIGRLIKTHNRLCLGK